MANNKTSKPYVIIFQDNNRRIRNALCNLNHDPFESRDAWLKLSDELKAKLSGNFQAMISVMPLGNKKVRKAKEVSKK